MCVCLCVEEEVRERESVIILKFYEAASLYYGLDGGHYSLQITIWESLFYTNPIE